MSVLDLSIREIHNALVNKEITALELVTEAIERVKTDETNALEATCFEEALEEAKNITEVKEDELFKGIPYVCKDNFSTDGIETTASSNVLNGYVPTFDAEVVTRLKKAGAILLAKTTMDELAMGGTGTTGHKGVTCNPYDHDRIIGGSSAGSCSLVTSACVPFALGSDTGDSVRKPASLGNIVGFKPTWGRVSRFGLFPFAPSLDSVGYFARNVSDICDLTTLLAGHDTKDFSSSYEDTCDYLAEAKKENSCKKIGYIKEILEDTKDKKIVESYYALIEKLKKEGYEVEEFEFGRNFLNSIYPTYMIISCSEATSNDACLDGIRYGIKPTGDEKTWEEFMSSARTRGFSSLIKRRFIIGSFSLLAENQEELFVKAQRARRAIVNRLNEFFEKYDYLLVPASGNVAPLIKDVTCSWDAKPNFVDNHLGLANLAGLPSLTLPMGDENGLGYGVNITGRKFEEANVFNLGLKIESLLGYKGISSRKWGK